MAAIDGKIVRCPSLAHHGINGQKWGVKHGPPYPLGSDMSTGKTLRKEVLDHDKEGKKHHEFKTAVAVTTAVNAIANPGGAIVGLGVLGVEAALAKGKVKRYFKDRENAPVDGKTGIPLKTRDMSERQDLAMVNPEFRSFNDNSKNNCCLCSVAYDLRRRGFDVTAETASVGYFTEEWTRWYPKAKIERASDKNEKGKSTIRAMANNTIKALEAQPDGARGTLLIQMSMYGGGHSMIYEKKNGKLRFLDGQSNTIYRFPKLFLMENARSAEYVRLDNVEPDWKAIREVWR